MTGGCILSFLALKLEKNSRSRRIWYNVDGSEIPFPTTVWMYKTLVNTGINYISTGAEFLPSTVSPGSRLENTVLFVGRTKPSGLTKISGCFLFDLEAESTQQGNEQ